MSEHVEIDSMEEVGEIDRARSVEQLSALLRSYDAGICYKPTSAEPDPATTFPELFADSKILYTIPPDPALVPADEARKIQELLNASSKSDENVFILIPGTRFDAAGTRHGKGGGWYDRFLNAAPREWLRIGLCYSDQFSNETLVRESWDEPMDFVCIVSKSANLV